MQTHDLLDRFNDRSNKTPAIRLLSDSCAFIILFYLRSMSSKLSCFYLFDQEML